MAKVPWPWEQEQEQEYEQEREREQEEERTPTPINASVYVPPPRSTDQQRQQRQQDQQGRPSQDPPPLILQEDAVSAIVNFLAEQGPDRGPFRLDRENQQNQNLPGVSLPPWLMQIVNTLAGHPMLPYAHDRAGFVRDALFLAAAAYTRVLQQYQDDEELRNMRHIIQHEQTLRQDLFVEELLYNNYVEDLGVASKLLSLKMQAGNREAVYQSLAKIFKHAQAIADKDFWRPTVLRFIVRVPEIREAMAFISDDERYKHDSDYRAWVFILDEVREQDREWDERFG